MSDKLPTLPNPAFRVADLERGGWASTCYTEHQMREYAAIAVAERDAEIALLKKERDLALDSAEKNARLFDAALSDRHALQGRGEHPAPCARQCEAQAFCWQIAAAKWAEREACAQVAVNARVDDASNYPLCIAAAIRARSKE